MIKLGIKMIFAMAGLTFLMGTTACEKDDPPAPTEGFKVHKYDPVAVAKTNATQTFAHYMPWFETPETNGGNWGMHWTMSTQNPNTLNADGDRNIASHYYPLIGPYASSDKDLIEYHLLLMKYSGIDGVLIDWYGSSDVNDYGTNRENSEILIDALDAVGLKYAIVYEDRTIPAVVQKDASLDRILAGQDDMLYLEDNYFNSDAYIQVNGAPLLLVFGPEEYHDPSDWEEVFGLLNEQPTFLALNYASSQTAPYSSGEYIWVDKGSLDNKYNRADQFEVFMGGAYPGFDDFYQEGGWGSGMDWSIDAKDGATFQQNLLKAKSKNLNYLQLITWNDFGEGTMIEPTKEFGFTMLEHVQEFTGVDYTASDLEEIYQLFQLRKARPAADQKYLDQAYYYLVSLQKEAAFHLIDSLKAN